VRGIGRRGAWLFAVFFAWPAVLVAPSGPSMSDSVILAAIRLVDGGTFTLSSEPEPRVVFLTEAFDISVHAGRIYSGVAPGATVLAAPVYLALEPLLSWFGDGVIANRRFLGYYAANSRGMGRPVAAHLKDVYLLQIALTWCLVAPLFAAFLARLDRAVRSWGADPGAARAVVFAAGLGGLALYYSSMYSRQALAYLLAWHAILSLAPKGGAPRPRHALVAGALLGAAVSVDYASAILVTLALVFLLPRLGRRERFFVLAPLAVALGLVALYHQAAFGSPLATPYHRRFWYTPDVLAREGVDLAAFQEGPSLGIGAPSLAVMAALCFGPFKGLFVYCPVLLLGLAGHAAGLFRGARRRFHLACLLVFLAYLAFNSTLGTHVPAHARHFWGGLSVLWGPRYLLGVVPFLACGLVALDWRRRGARLAVHALLLLSCTVNVVGTMFSDVMLSTNAFGPELEFPSWYAVSLLAARGPRVPLLASYGAPLLVQIAILAALAALTVALWRAVGPRPAGHAVDRGATVPRT
jgi:hypothetical protein